MAKKTKTVNYEGVATGLVLTKEVPVNNASTLNIHKDEPLPEAVQKSIERMSVPDPVGDANDIINAEYPWAVPSMTSPQRAILCELVRIRKAMEAK